MSFEVVGREGAYYKGSHFIDALLVYLILIKDSDDPCLRLYFHRCPMADEEIGYSVLGDLLKE